MAILDQVDPAGNWILELTSEKTPKKTPGKANYSLEDTKSSSSLKHSFSPTHSMNMGPNQLVEKSKIVRICLN